jgi:folate-dependent phosphoribosylglycinamide formyltransferase PurN
MSKTRLVYLCSLRNAAADKAGQHIPYKGQQRYMKSPLEYLAYALDHTELGDAYSLEAVVYDDDQGSPVDRRKLAEYGFTFQPGQRWFYPPDLRVQGRLMNDLLCAVPSTYRRLPLTSVAEREAGKSTYERQLKLRLDTLGAELVLVDGLLIILDELIRPRAPYCRKVVNIHPGITRIESPYERRGAYATLDALHGARGKKVVDWQTMQTVDVPVADKTGASFHYVDNGVDSGEVIVDALNTPIDPEDSILELRWNNFNMSLFPAMHEGLRHMRTLRVSAGDKGQGPQWV